MPSPNTIHLTSTTTPKRRHPPFTKNTNHHYTIHMHLAIVYKATIVPQTKSKALETKRWINPCTKVKALVRFKKSNKQLYCGRRQKMVVHSGVRWTSHGGQRCPRQLCLNEEGLVAVVVVEVVVVVVDVVLMVVLVMLVMLVVVVVVDVVVVIWLWWWWWRWWW